MELLRSCPSDAKFYRLSKYHYFHILQIPKERDPSRMDAVYIEVTTRYLFQPLCFSPSTFEHHASGAIPNLSITEYQQQAGKLTTTIHAPNIASTLSPPSNLFTILTLAIPGTRAATASSNFTSKTDPFPNPASQEQTCTLTLI